MKLASYLTILFTFFCSSAFADLRGYQFSGTIDYVAEDGSMDHLLGGTFSGEFVFDDEVLPFREEPTIGVYPGVELSITYTDINGVDYSLTMQNGNIAVLDDYYDLLDGFVVVNGPEAPVQAIIETDLPLPNLGQDLSYSTRWFGTDESILDGVGLEQEIDPDAPFVIEDINIYDTVLDEQGNEVTDTTYLSGAIESFSSFDVPNPESFRLTQSTNIGGYGFEGEFSFNEVSDAYSLRSGGASIGRWQDWFHFVYEPLQGDVDIRARVEDISQGWSSAGIMIRDELTSYSPYVANFATLYESGEFSVRKEDYVPYPAVELPSLVVGSWVRLAKSGNIITSYISSDGEIWIEVGSEAVEFSETFYIGIVGVSEPSFEYVESVVDNFTVIQ